jgi:methylase of polypeptide subunit release factors
MQQTDRMQVLFTLFEKVPRQGPGSTETTIEALRRLPDLPAEPRVLDVGAGSAAAARALARALRVPVEASDIHEPFLAAGRRRADEEGLGALLQTGSWPTAS